MTDLLRATSRRRRRCYGAAAMGGTLSATSAVGIGSALVLKLPNA